MAIEHFERPFTLEEEAELSRQITTALEDIQPRPIVEKRQSTQKILDVGCYVCLVFFSLSLFLVAGSQGWIWVLLVGILLVFFWQGHPGRNYLPEKQAEAVWEQWQERRRKSLERLQMAQENGIVQGVRVISDALVTAKDNPKTIFSEGTDQFYRVGENVWLFLYEFVEAPGNEEMAFTWFGEGVPKLESSSGATLAPLADRQEIRNQFFDGDLFALSLEELLSATPQMFESARRGNLFSPDSLTMNVGQ